MRGRRTSLKSAKCFALRILRSSAQMNWMGKHFSLSGAPAEIRARIRLRRQWRRKTKNGITLFAKVAPLFIEFLANYISVNHQKKKEEYSTYKAWSMAICIATLIFLFLFYVTKARTSLVLQISCILIVFAVSFYTYLVTKMDIHRTLLEEYKDKSYLELENEILKDTEEKSRKLTSTTTDSGTEVKL